MGECSIEDLVGVFIWFDDTVRGRFIRGCEAVEGRGRTERSSGGFS